MLQVTSDKDFIAKFFYLKPATGNLRLYLHSTVPLNQ